MVGVQCTGASSYLLFRFYSLENQKKKKKKKKYWIRPFLVDSFSCVELKARNNIYSENKTQNV